ncbi:MAG: type II toxin-antitoxin system prevent-host-death family antitoxin [Gemmatimonadetes bacterium]|nr:type II toxin-antitoxin system prevent-host-death family antitoxin [Gemmatimonadota bacterium]
MKDTYSLYEAKAHLSAIVRRVREGHAVIVTVHGEPAVEIRAVEPQGHTLAARLTSLEERGILVPPAKRTHRIPQLAKRPGALKRFLDDRSE